mmetsp:Transcript_28624/g.54766  ORF Transcript_28624/g.54766 Transcript_28624/m.54766 type:complete len:249 (-) Transcript_28624:1216-1962(-)
MLSELSRFHSPFQKFSPGLSRLESKVFTRATVRANRFTKMLGMLTILSSILPLYPISSSWPSVKPPALSVPFFAMLLSSHPCHSAPSPRMAVSKPRTTALVSFSPTIHRCLSASLADMRWDGRFSISKHTNSHPAPLFRSSRSNPACISFEGRRANCVRLHSRKSKSNTSRERRKAMRLPSDLRAGKAICRTMSPIAYVSNLSGRLSCQRMGDSSAAMASGGGWAVRVLMMKRSGAQYRGSSRNSRGT